MKLEEFNIQSFAKAQEELLKCCGSTTWADKLMEHFPFASIDDLKISSDRSWFSCTKNDWLEAFSHHPKIGQKKSSDEKLFTTQKWAEQEQSGVKNAEQQVLTELEKANQSYENKFGHIFIICASGKSASEMLRSLNERLNNDAEKEMHIAAAEQNKITHLRIDKLLS